MAEYRIYTAGTDGHFIGSEPPVCENDDHAIAKAKQMMDGHDVQVWNGPD